MKIKPVYAIAAVVAVGLLTTASSCTDSSVYEDEEITEQIMTDLQKGQPVPKFPYSQERENVIDILTARANPTATTSFFFNQGVKDPIFSCPSVGYAIPHTTQLTNPEQYVGSSGATLPMAEPVGTYTGDSTGTHVICRDANGRGFDNYWEGFVDTVSGPAEWDYDKGRIVLIGAPTGDFSTGE